jgi:hypothetical protein
MKRGMRLYFLIILAVALTIPVYSINTDLSVRHIAGNESNVKTVGLTILGASIYEGAPAFLGPKFNQMEECKTKFDSLNKEGASFIIVDTNDYCNALAYLNDKTGRLVSGGYDYSKTYENLPPGLVSFGTAMEITSKEVGNGLLMDNTYYAADTFKNVPVLKNAFAQVAGDSPVLSLVREIKKVWEVTRNIAFAVLLLAALITGISIMTSKAMSGKDTDAKIITAEKALPRVILAVILISSSYWIGELVVNTIVGSGITQGIAKFVAQSFISERAATQLDIPTNILFYQALTSVATAPWSAIVALLSLVFFVFAYIKLNISIIANIAFSVLYIIFGPLILAQGALPGDMSGEAFKKYVYNLLYYIGCGFLFTLLGYGARVILIMGNSQGDNIAQPLTQLVGSVPGGANIISWIYPIICVFILWYGDKIPGIASGFAAQISGAKNVGFLAPGSGKSK